MRSKEEDERETEIDDNIYRLRKKSFFYRGTLKEYYNVRTKEKKNI